MARVECPVRHAGLSKSDHEQPCSRGAEIADHLAAMVGTVAGLVPESRRMVFLYVAAGAVFATIAARGVTVPLYAHDLGASRFEVGALFSVATIAAALLSLPSGLLVDRFGARTLLGVSLAATARAAMMISTMPGAGAARGTRQHTGQGLALREPLRALARQAAFVPVTIGLIGMTLIWGTFGAFAPIFAREALGLPSFQVGLLLGLQAVFNAGSRPVAGRLVDRARRRWPIVLVGVIVWSAAMVILGHLTGFLVPAIVIAIGTPFIATSFVAIGVVFGDLSGASTRGVTMGMYGTVLFLGLSAGPLIFGPFIQGYGYAAGFTACAAVAVALVLVMAAMQAQPLRRRTAPAPLGDSETQPAATRQA